KHPDPHRRVEDCIVDVADQRRNMPWVRHPILCEERGVAQANSFDGQLMREKTARNRRDVRIGAKPTRRRDTISSVNILIPAVKIITRAWGDLGCDRHGLARLLRCSVAPPSLGVGLRHPVQVWPMVENNRGAQTIQSLAVLTNPSVPVLMER